MTVFRKIFRYLKPYTVMIVFSVALMIAEVASNVLQPKYMEQIVDDGVMQMNMDVITRAGIMMLVVAVAGGVGGFISCVLSNIYSQRFGSDLRKSLFRKILSHSPQQGCLFLRLSYQPDDGRHAHGDGVLVGRDTDGREAAYALCFRHSDGALD